jgi:hypothetical protein
MRDLLKRIDRLEQEQAPRAEPFRAIIRLIKPLPGGGGPAPWKPTWAQEIHKPDARSLKREGGESGEAFEARALAELQHLMMGGDPIPFRTEPGPS